MEQFDYVIVGGGSAGSVLASRISDSGASVCVLESGPKDRNLWIRIPAGIQKLQGIPALTWPYVTEGPRGTERKIKSTHGRVLGGSGSINGMMINRGQSVDYNHWAQLGNRGWGYADILPYFMRMERRIGGGDDRVRGRSGTIPVTDTIYDDPLVGAFREAAVNAGFPRDPDHNGPVPNGVCTQQFNILRGWRVSPVRAFLHPAMRRNANLAVRTGAHTTNLLFEGRRAVGVRYAQGENRTETVEVRARREVILCAGAIATPKILQISGVGPGELLRELGVPIVHELRGVGANLQDHYNVRVIAQVKDAVTINNIVTGPRLIGEVAKWLANKSSIIGTNPFPVFVSCRSHDAADATDLIVMFSPGSFKAESRSISDSNGVSGITYQMRPESRGFVHASSPDPFALPVIDPNYLATDTDRRTVVSGMRIVRRILSTAPFSRYIVAEDAPGHEVGSDEQLVEYARQSGWTCFHFTGSSRMGPASDPNAVVDDRLRVYGMEGLRVVDASIMPAISSGNTNAPTMMIAEKASDMILGRPSPAPVVID